VLVVLPVSRLINVNEFVPDSTSFMEISSWELNGGFNPMNVKIREQPA
jgi:hypothetical protein